jgi:hypothetical protein
MIKKIAISSLLISSVLFAGNGQHHLYKSIKKAKENSTNTYIVSELTEIQKEDLKFMYQEEKVARDVYLSMYNLYGSRIFKNIANAEQKHMDAIKSLLEKYSIEVPVINDTIGEFDLQELQELYYELLSSGTISEQEAFKVGELIELTDIEDLEEKISNTPYDIKKVYEKLLNGSYKHLEAFRKKL